MVVKVVVGEETHLRSAEDRLFQSAQRLPAQIGLLIGSLYSNLDRASVYQLIPTPPTDSGRPPCSLPDSLPAAAKKSPAPRSQPDSLAGPLAVDTEWVAEHARQVSRMLLGGMRVVGIYVWASESSFKSSAAILCQTVKAVAQASPFRDVDLDERLLIHISYSPRRWSCRSCSLTTSTSATNLRPCDFKMGKLLASLQFFRCNYSFEKRIPVFHGTQNACTFRDALQAAINHLANDLKNSKALIDGNLVIDDMQCPKEGPHDIELLLPFMKDTSSELCRENIVGLVVFSGVIRASTYLGLKVPVMQLISDIKEDIITSLQSRLDIIFEGLEGDVGSSADVGNELVEGESVSKSEAQLVLHELSGSKKPCNLLFPRRVFVSWLPGVIICDYLKHSETFEDIKCHCKEIMYTEDTANLDLLQVLEEEKDAETVPGRAFWSTVSGNGADLIDDIKRNAINLKENKDIGRHHPRSNINILLAFVICLLSIFVGLYVIVLGGKRTVY